MKSLKVVKNRTVYCIENIKTGRCYVGSTSNIKSRINNHFNCLKNGVHPNKNIQDEYDCYGEDSFLWYVITEAEMTLEECLIIEGIKIREYAKETEVFNIQHRPLQSYKKKVKAWARKKNAKRNKKRFKS